MIRVCGLAAGMPGAVKDLEKAVELDPNNAPAKAQLETLKK